MKKLFLMFLIVFGSVFVNAEGRDKFGLGAMIGEPTGISAKLWWSKTNALSAGLAWSLGSKSSFHLHADYLIHTGDISNIREGSLSFYYGVGVRILGDDKAKLGVRAPLGISYIFEDAPLDAFLEIVPVLNLTPETTFGFNGAIGMRYYF